eukprot:TRINITY_DN2625_c0_g1_i3.p1 TRINITY_DN2625_c0_g1~~TRINITY_DN2625_c0_g1_i3.p1  ORF type:complete len:457 (+),score=193.11 TRINITY_DN2625_c0_g1_i3:53-1372(+)
MMRAATRAARGLARAPAAAPRGLRVQCRDLSQKSLDIVKATLPAVAEAGPSFTGHFYKRMFAAHPELLNVFNISNQRQGRQQKALFGAIAACATNVLEHGTLPLDLLEGPCQKHCALNVLPAQYDVVGEHIVGTIVDLLNPGQEVLDGWIELYGALAGQCIKREEEIYKEAESKPGGWRGERMFVVADKEAKSSRVTEFAFAPEDGQPICDYKPGQYTTVWLKGPDWSHRQPRHYTLVFAPNGKDYKIAVKKEDMGLVSSYLHDRVAVGDKVAMSPPFGAFHVENAESLWLNDNTVPAVMLSAGIGITPTLAMLSNLKNVERPVLWLHAAQSGRSHPFRDYLVGLAKGSQANFTRRVWYEAAAPDDIRGDDNAALYHFDGHMDLNQVKELLPLGNAKATYFFCGPKEFMVSVAKQLRDFGVAKEQLAFEVFGPHQDIVQ